MNYESIDDVYELNIKNIRQEIRIKQLSKPGQAIVVTPTTGSIYLADAIHSVSEQDYGDVTHLIIIDGKDHYNSTYKVLEQINNKNIEVICLPYNTGKHGFNGHRIYAAISFLINSDYVLFLDEDCWFDRNHVTSLVDLLNINSTLWGYSMRKICSPEKKFICEDNCESIGRYPPFSGRPSLVDTNCYIFKSNILSEVAHYWYHPLGADRYFFNKIAKLYPSFSSSRMYTVNYRLKMNGFPNSSFFLKGNQAMNSLYGNCLPWK